MCTIFFAYRIVKDTPLIVAGNRDEFFDRPSDPMDYWDDAPHVLAGRDLRANGTWTGVNRQGRIAFVTNYRDPGEKGQHFQSRGGLPAKFLLENPPVEVFSEQLKKEGHQYRGFNLIFGSVKGLYYYTNRQEGVKQLEPGLYGLSNHLLDTPWPKVKRGKATLAEWGADPHSWSSNGLFQVLSDPQVAPDEELPDTGVGLGWERLLSATFIETLNYGTRNATIIRFFDGDEVEAEEWTWGGPGEEPSKREFLFQAAS